MWEYKEYKSLWEYKDLINFPFLESVVSLPYNLDDVRRAPLLCLPSATYDTVAAYLLGIDQACHKEFLEGFHEWLVPHSIPAIISIGPRWFCGSHFLTVEGLVIVSVIPRTRLLQSTAFFDAWRSFCQRSKRIMDFAPSTDATGNG